MMDNTFSICLGSNTDDGQSHIENAVSKIADVAYISAQSDLYTSPSYNGIGKDYYNKVIMGSTAMPLQQFIDYTKQIEVDCGRTQQSKRQGIVPIDIDVVTWNSETIRPIDASRPYYIYGLEHCK